MTASSHNSSYMRRFNPDAVTGLVIHLEASDLPVGAVTSWIDRKSGYEFTGTATRDTLINNKPTVTFNGTSDRLSTAGNITQVGGVSACTFIIVAVDTYTGANAIVAEIGDGLTLGSQTVLASQWPGSSPAIILANTGNSGNYSTSYFTETWSSPGILCAVNDFGALAGSETSTMRFNGVVPIINNIDAPENTNNCVALRMNLGARQDNSLYWSGSIAKLFLYNRRLSTDEMAFIERAIAKQVEIAI